MPSDLVPSRRHGLAAALALAFALVGCALIPAAAAAIPLQVSPGALTFPQETVGKTSPAQAVVVSNPLPGTGQIEEVAIRGEDPGEFEISTQDCANVGILDGGECKVEVTFSPQVGGARHALLEIGVNNVPNITVPLEGTGVTQRLTVPGSVSFPAVSVGSSLTQQIPLKNESEAGVNISNVKIEGTDQGDFNIEGNNCNGFVGPSMSCELTVRFSPTAAGTRESQLTVVSDGTPGEFVVALSGEGAAPELSFEPSSYDFGLAEVRSGGSRTTLTLRNTGATTVQLSNLEITGPDRNEFFISNSDCWGATLAAGATCSVEAQFNANNEGSFAAAVRISVGAVSFEAPLSARAERPVVTPSPFPLVFGPTTVGAGQTQVLTVTNEGHLPTGFFIGFISGGEVAEFKLLEENCTGRVIQPGESCSARIRFAPTSAGAKVATMSFFGNGEGPVQVPIEGSAVAPQVSLTPSAYDFGPVAVGTPGPVQVFQLRNESADPYAVDSVSLKGADLAEFSIRSDECSEAVLEPGESCAVAVRFAPGSAGAAAATLRLRGAAGTITAALSGEGRAAPASAAASEIATANGRVVFHFNRHPRAAGGQLTLGRARCESLQSCVVVLSGRPGTRPMPSVRIRLDPGSSAPLVVRLPASARSGPAPAKVAVSLGWKTGSARGGTSSSFALAAP
jgi:Abnormal spindle-like microcephaly-assoc'd, ASPM-SPD-2-Hydin